MGIDAEVPPLYDHGTVDVLSQKLPICLNSKSTRTYYSTSHTNNGPSNSRSLIVNSPFGVFLILGVCCKKNINFLVETEFFCRFRGLLLCNAKHLQIHRNKKQEHMGTVQQVL